MKVSFKVNPAGATCTFYIGGTSPGDSKKETFASKCSSKLSSMSMGESVEVEVKFLKNVPF